MEPVLNPRLVGVSGPVEGGIFGLGESEVTIGRHRSNRLPIEDASVSRTHCIIRRLAPDRFEIRDLESRNGTAVNGLPVTTRVLRNGDQIRLGDCHFLFLLFESDDQPSSAPELDLANLEAETVVLRKARNFQWEPLLQRDSAPSRASSSLAVLIRIGTGIQIARSAAEIARLSLEGIFEAIPADHGAILLYDSSSEEACFAYAQDRDGRLDTTVRVSSEIIAKARSEGMAVLARGPQPQGPQRRVLAVPIMTQDRTIGVLYLEARDPAAAFDDGHLEMASAIGGILGAPFENVRRLEWLEAENRRLNEVIDLDHDMVGSSPRMRDVFQLVGRVAPTDSTVLIRGESGTGKELVARAIHRNSTRAGKAFVAINCAALTETLLESELFGHEKGAFTGAIAQKQGKLEIADRGTLFLDEVGELPLAFQTKLLRVLQEREFERVGGTRPIRVDVRLIAATNRPLEAAIAANTFRQDLYYRLNVVSLTMPPLRERREDIPLLARHFAAKHGKKSGRRLSGLSQEAITCLEAYDWPGNVRELENAVERAVVLGSGELIMPDDLPEAVLDVRPAAQVTGGYHSALRDEKRRAIIEAVQQSGGSITEAAKLLGIHPNYLHRLIRNLDLKQEIKKSGA